MEHPKVCSWARGHEARATADSPVHGSELRKTKSDRSADEDEEADEATEQSQALPENTVPLQRVHELLDKMCQKDDVHNKANGAAFAGPEESKRSG